MRSDTCVGGAGQASEFAELRADVVGKVRVERTVCVRIAADRQSSLQEERKLNTGEFPTIVYLFSSHFMLDALAASKRSHAHSSLFLLLSFLLPRFFSSGAWTTWPLGDRIWGGGMTIICS